MENRNASPEAIAVEKAFEPFIYRTNIETTTAPELAALKIVRRFRVPLPTARLLVDLCGLGGRQ